MTIRTVHIPFFLIKRREQPVLYSGWDADEYVCRVVRIK